MGGRQPTGDHSASDEIRLGHGECKARRMPSPRRANLDGRVVVITGASGGLGRETAVQLAEEGCRVVVAARRAGDLHETVRLCEQRGGQAFAVVTDVTVEDDVRALAAAAQATWGRIDVWINNAGVTLFARMDQGAFEDHRRVIETNLFGAMLGARAVIRWRVPWFDSSPRRSGKRMYRAMRRSGSRRTGSSPRRRSDSCFTRSAAGFSTTSRCRPRPGTSIDL
jgi:NAD(P)-dependent dehydrogenase (short-subunit alcohol dehydrogenase family)